MVQMDGLPDGCWLAIMLYPIQGCNVSKDFLGGVMFCTRIMGNEMVGSESCQHKALAPENSIKAVAIIEENRYGAAAIFPSH